MRIKKTVIILSIIIILINIFLIINSIKTNSTPITTNAVAQQAQVGIVIEQRCGDGNCLSEEICSSCPSDCGGCLSVGGGSGRSSSPIINVITEKVTEFFIQPDYIKQSVKAGNEAFSTFKVVSKSTKDIIINIKPQSENLIKIFPKTFSLPQNQEKNININIKTSEETTPGLYSYNISVESGDIKKKLLYLLLIIKSKNVYFDATIGLSEKSRYIHKGDKITINPTLFNLGDYINEKVTIKYFIKDLNLNNIYEISEEQIINNQTTYSKEIEIPSYLQPGKYIVGVDLRYKDSVGMSTDLFEIIGETQISKTKKTLFIQSALITIIIIISTLLYLQHRKLVNIEKISNKKINQIKNLYEEGYNHKSINKKITSHIKLLNKSYKEGYIKKSGYDKFKKNLNDINSKLDKK